MEHPSTVALVEEAVALARRDGPALSEAAGAIPITHYTDVTRMERERAALFKALPIPLACSAEVSRAGATLVRELVGISLVLVRGSDGVVRGFKNACRHRATRLVTEDCQRKALVCPYHGWTYALDGALVHIPHAEAFPQVQCDQMGLVQVSVEERHGLVWVTLQHNAPDARVHLGSMDEELSAMSLGTHVVARRVVSEKRGNWKMLMEAFLEGYHIRTLHKKTIYPFFLDGKSAAQRVGLHVRHASVRRAALESTTAPLRELATVGHVIFPCTVLIAHPDWTSHVVVQPLAPDRFLWTHSQLIPKEPATDEERVHFEWFFSLIEENVFQKEDLFAIAEMQAGLETGANTELTFGQLESPALWFHDSIRQVMGE